MKFPDYAVIRRDRPTGGGGGLVTLVHHSLNYIEIQTLLNDNFAESIIVKTTISGLELQIVNLYIPPQSLCAPNFAAPILTNEFFIVGDINAHNDLWLLGANDNRGDAITDELDAANYVVLNDPAIPTRPSSKSSPDIVALPMSIALSVSWSVVSTLNSNHYPIAIFIDDDDDAPQQCRTYINYRKADWESFKRETELHFASTRFLEHARKAKKIGVVFC